MSVYVLEIATSLSLGTLALDLALTGFWKSRVSSALAVGERKQPLAACPSYACPLSG